MRIGLLITNLAGSGAERIVLNLARGFLARGINVSVFLLENIIQHEIDDGIEIHSITERRTLYKKLSRLGDYLMAAKLKRKITEVEQESGEKFSCIISNLPSADKVLSLIESDRHYYVIHMNYSAELEFFRKSGRVMRAKRKRRVYRKIYKDKNLITVSRDVENDMGKFGIQYRSIRTIYNPFDLQEIQQKSIDESVGVPAYEYILHPAAFRNQKRHDTLFEAIKLMKNDLKVVLLSRPFKPLLKMIEDYGLQDRVVVAGFHTNPFPFFKNAKMVVLSSEREGLPTVLIESLILHVPVVSTDCPSGPSEILTGELASYLSPVGDAAALACNVDRALKHYPVITPEHYAKFSDENVIQQYLDHCVGMLS